MNATDRIVREFDRLVSLGRGGVAGRPLVEQVVYYVVATRCEIDINGFASVYEQSLNPAEINVLVNGLRRIGEAHLAAKFWRGLELLQSNGFYGHMNWKKVSPVVKAEIDAIGKCVGAKLWDLDAKLASLLDDDAPAQAAG